MGRRRDSLLLLFAMLASVKKTACNGETAAVEITPVIPVCLTRCIIHERLIFKPILVKTHELWHQFKMPEET